MGGWVSIGVLRIYKMWGTQLGCAWTWGGGMYIVVAALEL